MGREAGRLGSRHETRQAGVRFLTWITYPRDASRAHDRATVTQSLYLVELLTDIQDAASFGSVLPERDKQLRYGLRGKNGSGLIKNQQLGIAQEGTHDFHALTLAHGQRMHMAVGIQHHAI